MASFAKGGELVGFRQCELSQVVVAILQMGLLKITIVWFL